MRATDQSELAILRGGETHENYHCSAAQKQRETGLFEAASVILLSSSIIIMEGEGVFKA